MEIIVIQQELEKLYNMAPKLYEAEAKAKSAFISLKTFEKSKLALCMSLTDKGSQNAKEQQARSSEEYRSFLQGMVDAEKEYIMISGKISSFEAKLKILQSLNKSYNV